MYIITNNWRFEGQENYPDLVIYEWFHERFLWISIQISILFLTEFINIYIEWSKQLLKLPALTYISIRAWQCMSLAHASTTDCACNLVHAIMRDASAGFKAADPDSVLQQPRCTFSNRPLLFLKILFHRSHQEPVKTLWVYYGISNMSPSHYYYDSVKRSLYSASSFIFNLPII